MREVIEMQPQRDDAGTIPIDVITEYDWLATNGAGGGFGMDYRRVGPDILDCRPALRMWKGVFFMGRSPRIMLGTSLKLGRRLDAR